MSHPGAVASCPLSPPLLSSANLTPFIPRKLLQTEARKKSDKYEHLPSGLCSVYFFSVTNKTSPKKFENRRKKRNPPPSIPNPIKPTKPAHLFLEDIYPSLQVHQVFLSLSRISSLTSRVHPPSLSIPSPVLRAGFTVSTQL